jgi:hypothetical protein
MAHTLFLKAMKASFTFGTFRRMLQQLLGQIGTQRLPPPPQAVPRQGSSAGLALTATRPQAARTMRSPEQVRSDLVRLRASAKERHARVPLPRQTTFDAAVFKDFVPKQDAARIAPSDAAYPKTVFVARGSSRQ